MKIQMENEKTEDVLLKIIQVLPPYIEVRDKHTHLTTILETLQLLENENGISESYNIEYAKRSLKDMVATTQKDFDKKVRELTKILESIDVADEEQHNELLMWLKGENSEYKDGDGIK